MNHKYKEPGTKFPTSTVHQMRIPLFVPVEQVRNRDGIKKWFYESQFGSVTVKNCRLTQTHRDIIDAIFSNYKPIQ